MCELIDNTVFRAVLRIRDVYPGSRFLSIPDPNNSTKRGGGTQKFVIELSKIWVFDPGLEIRDSKSGIQKKPIPDPGSRIFG